MYSIFSVFEYTVVLSNMAYHFTSYYDFYNTSVTLGNSPGDLGSNGVMRQE